MTSAQTLQPPGAGLPFFEIAWLKPAFKLKCLLMSQAESSDLFQRETEKILELVRTTPIKQAGTPVLIKRVTGIDDSSRRVRLFGSRPSMHCRRGDCSTRRSADERRIARTRDSNQRREAEFRSRPGDHRALYGCGRKLRRDGSPPGEIGPLGAPCAPVVRTHDRARMALPRQYPSWRA
jgi:hypothetical protein